MIKVSDIILVSAFHHAPNYDALFSMIDFRYYILPVLVTFLLPLGSCKQTKAPPDQTNAQIEKEELRIISLLPDSNLKDRSIITFQAKEDTTEKLEIGIGKTEAEVLAWSLTQTKVQAVLPLDLLQNAITKFGYTVKEVLIDSLINGVYTAKIICTNPSQTITLKARPSDATIIATKCSSPIYADKRLLYK
ncbi:MAG: bifunctional nuclease family protein [Flavisolibacter sp.]|nr:bifunctional nuclease family protein [Flavisolibacter sp.]MBD0284526.1 bifunctional nuclease family protein [Flavisolibacter sp.]MBD0351849.1 bifunctional nuclease family protein [Flavisolibacter sp.]